MNLRLLATSAIVLTVAAPAFAQISGFTDESDGYSWRRASLENRTAYCRAVVAKFAEKGSRVSAQTLFDAIQEFYTSEDPGILKRKLFDVTAILAYAASDK